MKTEALQTYIAECGREIDNASAQLHEITNWSVAISIGSITGIALAPSAFPSRWTLALIAAAFIFLLRFYVRSCISFSYLVKWNRLHRLATLCLQFPDTHEITNTFDQAVLAYHIRWKSALPMWKIVWSNLKLGFLHLLAVATLALVYGLVETDWSDWFTYAVLVMITAAIAYEIYFFPTRTYLQYVEVRKLPQEKGH